MPKERISFAMNLNKPSLAHILAACCALGVSTHASALTYTPSQSTTSDEAFNGDIQTTDLVEAGSSALAATNGVVGSTDSGVSINNLAGINDGAGATDPLSGSAFGAGGPDTYIIFAGNAPDSTASATITFNLNTSLVGGSPLGYNISGFDSIAGWSGANDAGQNLTVYYETVASSLLPAADRFTELGNYDNELTPADGADPVSTESAVTDANLTGVVALEFVYSPLKYSGSLVMEEIDVDGSAVLATTPEPSTWALLLGGMGALALVQRLRQSRSLRS